MMLDVDANGSPNITKKGRKNRPDSPIDHIFTKGFEKKTCDVLLDNEYSDHGILWAEVWIL